MAGKRKSNGANAKQPKSKAAKADAKKPARAEYVQKIVTWCLDFSVRRVSLQPQDCRQRYPSRRPRSLLAQEVQHGGA